MGHVATESGTECDPEKTSAIQNWPRPTNVKEVRSFLGLANFYRSYIPQCATIAYPMNQLTRKHVKFKWDEKCEESFNTFKHCLEPHLFYPTQRVQASFCSRPTHLGRESVRYFLKNRTGMKSL